MGEGAVLCRGTAGSPLLCSCTVPIHELPLNANGSCIAPETWVFKLVSPHLGSSSLWGGNFTFLISTSILSSSLSLQPPLPTLCMFSLLPLLYFPCFPSSVPFKMCFNLHMCVTHCLFVSSSFREGIDC